jgi:hypothetical protein
MAPAIEWASRVLRPSQTVAEPGDGVAESKVAHAGEEAEPKSESDDRQSWTYDWHDLEDNPVGKANLSPLSIV